MQENNQNEKKRGNPSFVKGGPSPNPLGRGKIAKPKPRTNREIRSDELMKLLRKFSPHQTKAIQAAIKIIDNNESADANKLRASALIVQTYRQLLLDVFDAKYDTEENNEIQEDNSPIFSLKIIGQDDDEKTGT